MKKRAKKFCCVFPLALPFSGCFTRNPGKTSNGTHVSFPFYYCYQRSLVTQCKENQLVMLVILENVCIFARENDNDMANQSKNRVKLNKEYMVIGKLPKSSVEKIKIHFDFPDDALSIRINVNNALKHNNKHLIVIEKQLSDLGVTKEGYISYIVKNFNQIRLGNKPKSLVLVVLLEETSHMAALHLHYDKNENFWLVKSFHASRLSDLERMELVWEK